MPEFVNALRTAGVRFVYFSEKTERESKGAFDMVLY